MRLDLPAGSGNHEGQTRRFRFMESADFTAANRWLFEVLARSVRHGKAFEALLFGFEMDPTTPGAVLNGQLIDREQLELIEVTRAHESGLPLDLPHAWDRSSRLDEMALHILKDGTLNFCLAAHARSGQTWVTGLSSGRRLVECVAVQVLSPDRSLATIYLYKTLPHGRPALAYSLLDFTPKD